MAPASPPTIGTRVHLADPVTLSKASFSCDGAFLPAMGTTAQPAAMAAQQQRHLYEATCGRLLEPSPPLLEQERRCSNSAAVPVAARRVYFAYGQTASGKTYSLFGETSTRSSVEELSPTAGVVPRYLYDVFSSRSSASEHHLCDSDKGAGGWRGTAADVFVDLSCFEIYNEVTSDLVALSVALSMSDSAHSTGATHPPPSSSLGRQLPVWAAHSLYRSEQQSDEAEVGATENLWGMRTKVSTLDTADSTTKAEAAAALLAAPPTLSRFLKTEYKSTEKQQVLRSLERARCTSFAEAQAVLQALLALRQECATGRNQSSSRGHLVLCVQVYAPAACDRSAGEWLMQHETAFVDLAGSESCKPTDSTVPDDRASTWVDHHLMTRGSTTAGVARSSRASSHHSRISLETSMQSGASSHRSSISSGSLRNNICTTTTTTSAYHRSLLRPSLEADKKEAQVRRLRETRCINASLLALRKVFRALYEATQSSHAAATRERLTAASAALPRRPPRHHAPFKDSALTAILEPFLVPQTSTVTQSSPLFTSVSKGAAQVHVVLLVCCSSRSADFFETVASLRLGAEATAVNPEIVLCALPAQQREQQQRQLYGCGASPQQSHRQIACHRHREDRVATGRVPWPLFRSASAPSGRLGLTNDGDEEMEEEDFSGGTKATCMSAAAQRHNRLSLDKASTHAKAAGTAHRRREGVMSTADAARLCDEARRYKDTAHQLYKQCKSLCESYDACVAELQLCRFALSERDARITELEAALEGITCPRTGVSQSTLQRPSQKSMQPRTSKATCISAAARAPHLLDAQCSHQKGTAVDAASKGTPIPSVDGKVPPVENAAPAVLTTTSSTAGPMRAASLSSTEREGGGHWMVSVSPFSTASRATETAPCMAVVRECAMTSDDEEGDNGSVSSGSRDRFQLLRSTVERQQQRARSIMETLLARQIFPSDAPEEPASHSSPLRACSPSPTLPTLSTSGALATASSSAKQQDERNHSSGNHVDKDTRAARDDDSSSEGGLPIKERDAAVGPTPHMKAVAKTSVPIAPTFASWSPPLESHNTARSSSAGATVSSTLEKKGSVSAGRPSCDSVTEGLESDPTALPSSTVLAAHGSPASAGAASTVPTLCSSSMNSSSLCTSDTAPHSSLRRVTATQIVTMSTERHGNAPHAEAMASGDEEDAVEEVVMQRKKHSHVGVGM
ncbi:hypothetical protein JKF63_06830 [Porcisia hertigi]|uniref:Kinesin motor domain-containing protein n=1 Tax=Porcisia hertigi TaxID=2761500 RepID=A0A836LJ76_9TRYP|nr:hypothetical protein JKF63_06830 [Porcisia hertigi]